MSWKTLAALPWRIRKTSGYGRAVFAFGAGALSALALPPFDLWPILFLTFPVLTWLVDGIAKPGRAGAPAAAWIGWCFGFGYFLAGLYWFGYAYHYLVDTAAVGWLLPVALMALTAYLALYPALGLALARLYWPQGPVRVVSLAVAMALTEWLRGHLVTDFPWNAIGYVLTGPLVIAQSASVIGTWGLTFCAVLIFASPAVLGDDPRAVRRGCLSPVGGLILLAALAGGGALRLAAHPTESVAGVSLRLVQPDLKSVDQEVSVAELQNRAARYRALSTVATPSRPHGLNDVTHLIWPEAALPFYRLPPDLVDFLPPATVLITGSLRLAGQQASGGVAAYNSIFVVDRSGKILGYYDKKHLVPFGEYTPFHGWLEASGLMRFVRPASEFLSGGSRRDLATPDAPDFLPTVCYEIIFPDEVAPRDGRPGWIVNVTNDGWFGASSGPYQHFRQARMRAIEQGLPLVRAANSGISAVVDPLGRIVASLPLDSAGVIDAELPRALSPTIYARYGDWTFALMVGLALLSLFFHYFFQRS